MRALADHVITGDNYVFIIALKQNKNPTGRNISQLSD